MSIAEWIRKKKLSLNEVADAVGVTYHIVRKWVRGENSPRLIHAIKLNEISKGRLKFKNMLCEEDHKIL